jgi:hypothetical protein
MADKFLGPAAYSYDAVPLSRRKIRKAPMLTHPSCQHPKCPSEYVGVFSVMMLGVQPGR